MLNRSTTSSHTIELLLSLMVGAPAMRASRRRAMLVVGGVAISLGSVVLPSTVGLAGSAPQSSSARATAIVGLQQGSRGDAVRSLQQALVAAGLNVAGGVDGIFGVGTAAAVKQFQSARGSERHRAWSTRPPRRHWRARRAAFRRVRCSGSRSGPPATPSANSKRHSSPAAYKTKGDADGAFGVNTVNALTSFQYAQRIKVTARVDEATLAALGTPAPVPAAQHRPGTGRGRRRRVRCSGSRSGPPATPSANSKPHSSPAAYKTKGDADGTFGVNTVNALTSFQYAQRIKVTPGSTKPPSPPSAPPPPSPPPNPPRRASAVRSGSRRTASGAVGSPRSSGRSSTPASRCAAVPTASSVAAPRPRSWRSRRRRGSRATGVVDQATAEALALTPGSAPPVVEAPSITLQAFPVQGKCFFGDTWHVSRGDGRLHEGVDIGAAEGKYVYAAADGRITKQYWVGTNQLTGNGLIVRMADGTYFFYAHLLDFAPGIGVGTPVKAGQIIGYVGTTGNSGIPHLHFEVHPEGRRGGQPVPARQGHQRLRHHHSPAAALTPRLTPGSPRTVAAHVPAAPLAPRRRDPRRARRVEAARRQVEGRAGVHARLLRGSRRRRRSATRRTGASVPTTPSTPTLSRACAGSSPTWSRWSPSSSTVGRRRPGS